MRHMKHKDNVIHIRLDGQLLADLNELARRLGDDNTSSAARWAMRLGLLHSDKMLTPKPQDELAREV
jgi:hypothetical protein